MSPDPICHRPWKGKIRGWGAILFLCLLGAVAAIGARVLIESVGSAGHARYAPTGVPPRTVSPRHEWERGEYERQDRVVLEKGK